MERDRRNPPIDGLPARALATALARAAHESGRATRERETVAMFEAMVSTEIPRRALSLALSGTLDRKAHAIQCADGWASAVKSGAGGIYVLAGPVGTGKTVAAAWWACRVRSEWVSASALGLLPHVKASERIFRLIRAPALVLDDVGGQGTTSPHAVDRLATLIRERHADMRPTLITTNLAPSAFADVYDGTDDPGASRLLDRMRESGAWEAVLGGSRRETRDDPSPARVDQARAFVACLEEVEAVSHGSDPRGTELERMRAMLNLDSTQVSTLVADVQTSWNRTDSMISDLLRRTRVAEPEKSEREIDVEDGVRREQLRRQAEGLRGRE